MKKFIPLLVFLLTLMSAIADAQDAVDDFGIWSTISIDKKISQKFGVALDEELRTFDNASRIDQYFTNAGVNYKLDKNIRFGITYRFINKGRDDMSYSKRHRIYFDASYRKKVYAFNVSYRFRIQGQVKDYRSSDNGKHLESIMRHKLDVKYNYKRFTPYVAAEFFFQFVDPGFPAGNNLWNRERFYIGSDYDLNKKSTFGCFFMLQRTINIDSPQRDFILGLEYNLSF